LSLKTLALCLQGDEAMNDGVDEMYQNILENKLPTAWRVSTLRVTHAVMRKNSWKKGGNSCVHSVQAFPGVQFSSSSQNILLDILLALAQEL
jgi:hypothetical protein